MGARVVKYDVVRAAAILMVIAVHCRPSEASPLLSSIDCRFYTRYMTSLLCGANVLFFMLSGRFNIRRLHDGEWGRYYCKRMRAVLVPMLVFAVIFSLRALHPAFGSPLHVCKEIVLNALGGMAHGIYWFPFSIFGMLMVAPFFFGAFERTTGGFRKAFLLVWLVWTTVYFVAGNTGLDFSWKYPLSGFFFFFLLGSFFEDSYLNGLPSRALGAACILASLANGALAYIGWGNGINDMSPLYGITAVCLYALLLRADPEQGSFAEKAFSLLSKHSFIMYLVHPIVIDLVSPSFAGLANVWGPLYHVALFAAVVAISLPASIAVNVILVRPAQLLFDKAVDLFKHLVSIKEMHSSE